MHKLKKACIQNTQYLSQQFGGGLFDIFDLPGAIIDGFDLVYHHKTSQGGTWGDLDVKRNLTVSVRNRTGDCKPGMLIE